MELERARSSTFRMFVYSLARLLNSTLAITVRLVCRGFFAHTFTTVIVRTFTRVVRISR